MSETTKKSKTVSTASKQSIAEQNAKDAIMREQLLSGSSPNVANGGAGGRMTIDEVLHTYFDPTDLVRIKNPFEFDTGWAYSDPKDIVIEQPNAETRRVYGIGIDKNTGKNYQKTRLLHAGESLVLQGWEAYVGLTRFFKQWAMTEHDPQSINDMSLFRKFMTLVYDGIYDPNETNKVVDDTTARVALENDLGLTDGANA